MTTPTDWSQPISPADVATYTGGRVPADTPGLETMVAAALDAVHRYCGWHVFPTITESVRLDGPGGRLLNLPTLHLVELVEVTNDGTVIEPDTLTWSTRGMIARRSSHWSDDLGAITVDMRHGFEHAPALAKNVCEIVGQSVQAAPNPGALTSLRVGDRQETYALTMAGNGLPAGADQALWDSYRLPRLA